MARKLRLEFPGACYHVINRGNYRRDIFATEGAKAAFEDCLFEACERSAWQLHAYVVMRNHYHLALETPAGNLVSGMQWLQATFANRFNRLRDERGHLFQARYKAILFEEGEPFALAAHYIHLNPARAGAIPIEQLANYRYSSYWRLRRPAKRPPWLRLDAVLANTGGLPDRPAGWAEYQAYLEWQYETGPAGKSRAYVNLSKGWAVGSTDFKAALVQDHAVAALSRAWETAGAAEIRRQRCERVLADALRVMGRDPATLGTRPRVMGWKVALAYFLKKHTPASNGWLASRLGLGSPKYVSHLLSRLRTAEQMPAEYMKLAASRAAES